MSSLYNKIWFLLIATFPVFISQIQAQELNLNLTPSNYNDYNISCFGNSDGSINLTISGGIPPYKILWSTADTIEDLENLPAGYYTVRVTDSDTIPQITEAEITLSEPRQIRIVGTIHKYPNGYNISVYGACNGMVNVTAEDGVGPYSWLWSDNSTLPNRTSVCAGWFSVIVVDNNGCQAAKEGYMKEPTRGDWLLSGNAGTESDINYLGTIDSTDFVVKTNNSERLRISSSGDIEFHGDLKLDSASTDTIRLVFVDRDGFLRTYAPGNPSPNAPSQDWNTSGNDVTNIADPFIGSTNPGDLVFKTATSTSPATEKMRITQDGIIGIGTVGTTLPPGTSNYKLIVEGKVGFREAYVKLSGTWPDYVFDENYKLTPIEDLQTYLPIHQHLPGMPTAAEIESSGQNLGEIQRLQQEKIEELFLYLIELNNKIVLLENENNRLKRK